MIFLSNSNNKSPAFTLEFTDVLTLNPLPFIFTVSIPTCIKTSTPSSESKPIACLVSAINSIVPLNGAYTLLSTGSIATPFPIAPEENTGSLTFSNSITLPDIGLFISLTPVFKTGCPSSTFTDLSSFFDSVSFSPIPTIWTSIIAPTNDIAAPSNIPIIELELSGVIAFTTVNIPGRPAYA